MQNSKKPFSTHHLVEASDGDLYFVDSSNQKVLLKTADEGTIVSTIETRDRDIQGMYYDRSAEYIWFVDCGNGAGDTQFTVWYLDLSDDSVNEVTTQVDTAIGIWAFDIVEITAGQIYVFGLDNVGILDYDFSIWRVDTHPSVLKTVKAEAIPNLGDNFGLMTVVGTDAYMIVELIVNQVEIFKFSEGGNTLTSVQVVDTNSEMDNINQRAIAYDGSDILSYIVKDKDDSLYYFYSYSIANDTQTKGAERNAALNADRNAVGTVGSPWEFEKGFHIVNSFVYQIQRGVTYLLKLQDIGLSGGETIIAISDKYLITSNSDLYLYTELLNDNTTPLNTAIGRYGIYNLPKLSFTYTTALSTDTIIEMYENSSGTYTKCFSGKAGRPQYNRGKYEFQSVNLGYDDLIRPISYDAVAEGLDEVVINLINNNSEYLYCDVTSVPNIAVSITQTWDNQRLGDALYTCCVLGNAYFSIEPNGYVYFRAYSNPRVYTTGTEGLFPGTFTFTSDANGAVPAGGWADLSGAGCSARVGASAGDHDKVLDLDDAHAVNFANATYTDTQSSGTMEFWMRVTDITDVANLWIYNGVTGLFAIKIDASQFQYIDNVGWTNLFVPVNDTWYRVRIDIECTGDAYLGLAQYEYNLYVYSAAGALLGSATDVDFNSDQVQLTSLNFATGGPTQQNYYLDAFGFTWDGYTIGDNAEDISEDTPVFSQDTNNMGNPTPTKVQFQYNTWIIEGGWDATASAPFKKTEVDTAHKQQFGELLWKGRPLFPEARSQTALDAIATGLKAWQGMQDNPDIASFIIKKFYYPVAYKINYQFTFITEFASAADFILVRNIINFKVPNLDRITISTNIVRRG